MNEVLKEFYFKKFEDRIPYEPVRDTVFRTYLFRFLGILAMFTGAAYICWRWRYSLNEDSLWFAVPLVIAETLSYIGTGLMVFNYWGSKDPEIVEPPHMLSDIEDLNGREDRPIKIDVFIASYNEEVELVRYSIRDAKNMSYPYDDVQIKIYVLDDGRRDGRDPSKENMKQVCEEEQIGYLTRESNEGFKAGNLKNGLAQTDGDIFVILDADTRPFKSFLLNTTGYFKNKKVAWVQTPQWFYDTTEPVPVSKVLMKYGGTWLKPFRSAVDAVFGRIKTGADIFGNDPRIFYELILRKRNYHNASFCCGAGSVHRREAVMKKAINDFVKELNRHVDDHVTTTDITDEAHDFSANDYRRAKVVEFMNSNMEPFKFHASEDIYTSMIMHADDDKWESVQHPQVECKMLSPQDLDSCIKQRSRYALGSLDIAFKDNPLLTNGLNWRQKICYFNTIWSYFSPLWLIIFLLSPIIFFYTQALPVKAYSFDFFKYFLVFQILNTLAFAIGNWGINTVRGEQYYISLFWINLRSIISAVKGEKVKFNVTPKDKQNGSNNFQHIWPHLLLIGLTFVGILYNCILVAFDMHPTLSGFVSNVIWGLLNVYSLVAIVRAAYYDENAYAEEMETEHIPVPAFQDLVLQQPVVVDNIHKETVK